MNESVWWSFLYFMGEGRARDWGKSQVSQGQGEGQPSEKKQLPPDLEAQGAAIKKTPPAGKARGGKEKPPPAGKSQRAARGKTPASWKKPGGGQETRHPRLASKGGAGSRSARACEASEANPNQG